MPQEDKSIDRRQFLKSGIRGAAAVGIVGAAGLGVSKTRKSDMVWQIDPNVCVACGNCEILRAGGFGGKVRSRLCDMRVLRFVYGVS